MTRAERGAATVQVLLMATLLMVLASALSAGSGLVIAHRRAQSAADLAALAAASALATGRAPCAEAERVAALNHASIRRCFVTGAEVSVEVGVPGPRWLGRRPELSGRARAGPG